MLKLRICETETANIEERYRKFQLRICETANIEDCENQGISVVVIQHAKFVVVFIQHCPKSVVDIATKCSCYWIECSLYST